MTRRSHGRPALPPDAKDEILHVLFANMEISGDEIAAIMARLPDWERPANATMRIKDYGKQRVFVRASGSGNEDPSESS